MQINFEYADSILNLQIQLCAVSRVFPTALESADSFFESADSVLNLQIRLESADSVLNLQIEFY